MAVELFDYLHVTGKSPQTLVLLHGSGGDKESMATIGRQIAPDASLLALDGQVMQDGQRRFFKRQSMGLYDMVDMAARTRDLVAFLRAAFDRLRIDAAQVTGLGYSNGANILANMILTGTSPFSRAVIMHPLIPFIVEDWPDLSAQNILVTGGTLDAICPAPWTEKLAEGLRVAGATVTLNMHKGGHELAADEIAWARDFVAA